MVWIFVDLISFFESESGLSLWVIFLFSCSPNPFKSPKLSVAKGLNLKNATNLPNHAKNHATKKTLKRSHIFGQRRHNFDQLKIFSIAFFSQKIRNCHDLGKRRHNLSWRRHKSDILNQIIKRRHIFELWRVHATSNFMAPQGGPKTPLWRDHATFGNTAGWLKILNSKAHILDFFLKKCLFLSKMCAFMY